MLRTLIILVFIVQLNHTIPNIYSDTLDHIPLLPHCHLRGLPDQSLPSTEVHDTT